MMRIAKWLGMLAMALNAALLVWGCQANARQRVLEEKRYKESYSLGYQTGMNLKAQKVDVDVDVYGAGIRAALSGNKPELSQEEIRAALTQLGKAVAAVQKAEKNAKAERNLSESKTFLDGNRTRAGVITLPSGLQYRVVKEGAGRMPMASDTVTVNYRGVFTNGAEFVSSYKDNKPTSANLTRVIPGWKEALPLMREGAKWQLFIPPELAYGEKGATGIEPNSTLIFDVELVSVTPGPEGPRVAANLGAKNR